MTDSAPVAGEAAPLCIDLDGTLVRTDLLHEMLLVLAKQSPLSLLALPGWLMTGKANFKDRVAERVDVDVSNLPYRAEVLELIDRARAEGRPVVLATASPTKVADSIAGHLGVFDAVLSSGNGTNLSSTAKGEALAKRFGERGFDYIGNDKIDFKVFERSRQAVLVSSNEALRRGASSIRSDAVFIDDPRGSIRTWIKAFRVHQWLKNLLIFVPLAAAQSVTNVPLLLAAIIAFVSYSLCASSVYLLNDLLDLASDRRHHKKKSRPFASGALPLKLGLVAAPLLLGISIFLATLLPAKFLVVLAAYYVLTVLYSFWLKKQVIVDVMLLAGLYTLRIIAGSAATGIKPSFWLLALSMFVFLSLAMVKRYSELKNSVAMGQAMAGRGYHPDDLPVVLALGSSSGMVSALILAMYTQAQIVPSMYPAPEWLWLAPPLMLYWMTRMWMKAQRGEVDDDPVIFAAKDWQSLVIAVVMLLTFVVAHLGWPR